MSRLVVLDAGPLGLLARPPDRPETRDCLDWLERLRASDARTIVPEIADYEVRRELLRIGATAGIRRLDGLKRRETFLPIRRSTMLRAAEFWAIVRRAGKPTADPQALDADCILAAQASLVGRPGDRVSIATTNAVHLNRFPGIVAREWTSIAP